MNKRSVDNSKLYQIAKEFQPELDAFERKHNLVGARNLVLRGLENRKKEFTPEGYKRTLMSIEKIHNVRSLIQFLWNSTLAWDDVNNKVTKLTPTRESMKLTEGRKSNILKVLSQLHAYLKRYQDLDKTEARFEQRLEDAGCTDMYAVIDDILDIVDAGKKTDKAELLNRVYKTYFPKTAKKDPASDEEVEEAIGDESDVGDEEAGQAVEGDPEMATFDNGENPDGTTLGDVRKSDEAYMGSEDFYDDEGDSANGDDLQSDLDRSRGKLDDFEESTESFDDDYDTWEDSENLMNMAAGGDDFDAELNRWHNIDADIKADFPSDDTRIEETIKAAKTRARMMREAGEEFDMNSEYDDSDDFGDIDEFDIPDQALRGTRHPNDASGSLNDSVFAYIEEIKSMTPDISNVELADEIVNEFSDSEFPMEKGMAYDIIEDYDAENDSSNEEATEGDIEEEYESLSMDGMPDDMILDKLVRKYKLTRHEIKMILGGDNLMESKKKVLSEKISLPDHFKQLASLAYTQLSDGKDEFDVMLNLRDKGLSNREIDNIFDFIAFRQPVLQEMVGPTDQGGTQAPPPSSTPATPYDTSSSSDPASTDSNSTVGTPPQDNQTQELLQNPEFADFFQAMSKINPNDLQNLTQALGQK
jgi:hypothetical protein